MQPRRSSNLLRIACLSLATLCIASAARAQALAEHVPQDAVVYAGWAGAGKISGFEKTHLKAIGDLLPFQELFEKRLPALIGDKLPPPKNDDAAKLVQTLATLAWENPSAFYSEGMGRDDNGDEQPSLVLLIDAGAEADAVEKDLQQRLDVLVEGNAIPNIIFFRKGSVLAVTVNRVAAGSPLDLNVPMLDTHPSILEAVKQASGKTGDQKPASVIFLNVPNWIERGRAAINEEGKLPPNIKLAEIEKPLNFKDLGAIVLTSRPEGAGWQSDGFIPAAAPRTGVVDALFDDRPADATLLAALPANTLTAQSYIVDLGKYLMLAKSVGDAVMPNGGARVTSALALASMMIGGSGTAITDVLDQTGKDWVLATLPSAAPSAPAADAPKPDTSPDAAPAAPGKPLGTIVLLNRPKDPAKVMASLTIMVKNGVNIANARLGGRVKLIVTEEKLADGSVLFIPVPEIPGIQPNIKAQLPAGLTIASSGGVMGMGTDKASVLETLAAAGRPEGGGFLKSAKFLAVHSVIAAPEGARRDFVDAETLVPQSLAGIDAGLTILATMKGEEGAKVVEEIRRWIPSVDALKPHLGPAGSATWADASGYHFRSLTPFPGADLLGNPSNAGVGGAAIATSIMLPSLNKAREAANRVKSMENLHHIETDIIDYCNTHQGKYPPDLGALVKDQGSSVDLFVNPRGSNFVPKEALVSPDTEAAWVNEHGDYEYLLGGINIQDVDGSMMVAFERNLPPAAVVSGRVAVFGDGHSSFVSAAGFDKSLADTKAKIDKLRQPK